MSHHRFITLLALLIATVCPPRTDACDGSRRPNCGRSVWLAKWVEAVVVHPGDLADIEVTIGLLPYATWNEHPNCAQPSSASLLLRLVCEPDNGGPPVEIGPVAVPVGVPMTPGGQPVLTGPGMTPVLGGGFALTIPAGTLPAGVNYVCDVLGEYNVTFTGGLGGAGSGTLTGVGDTQVCIVEPSPLDPSLPRLDMALLDMADTGFVACRKGDQATNWYLIQNNDDQNSVVLDFETWTNQVARTPTGGTAEDTFSISSKKKNTDNFPQAYDGKLFAGEFLSTDGIMDKSDQRIFGRLVLYPGEVELLPIKIRSHGMCANGSCSEVIAKVSGTFSDGTPAVACAGTALLVEDVPAKSPLCEYTVNLKVSPNTDGRWTRPEFDKNHMLMTHFDNIEPFGGATIATSGANLNSPWPTAIADYIRTESPTSSFRCTLDGFRLSTGFQRDRNKITVTNLPDADFSLSIPHLAKGAKGSTLNVLVDAANQSVEVLQIKNGNKPKTLFEGPLSQLVSAPPAGLSVDTGTCLELTKTGPGPAPWLAAWPGYLGGLFDASDDPANVDVHPYDQRTLQPLAWGATSDVASAAVVAPTGNIGDPIVVDWNLAALTTVTPDTEIGCLAVSNGSALNTPLPVPIVARKQATIASDAIEITVFDGALFPGAKKQKDTLTISGFIPVTEGMNLKGLTAIVDVAGTAYAMDLNKKGKGAGKGPKGDKSKATFQLKPDKIDGVVQAGPAPFTFQLKKAAFAASLKYLGVFPAGLPGEGVIVEIPIKIGLEGDGDLLFNADGVDVFVVENLPGFTIGLARE